MKQYIPTFEQFVSENYDAEGFKPENMDEISVEVESTADLTPGKKYHLTVDGETAEGMIFGGKSGGEFIFNHKDKNEDPMRFSEAELADLISDGGVSEVADTSNPAAPTLGVDSDEDFDVE